jgi:hypothetical protein
MHLRCVDQVSEKNRWGIEMNLIRNAWSINYAGNIADLSDLIQSSRKSRIVRYFKTTRITKNYKHFNISFLKTRFIVDLDLNSDVFEIFSITIQNVVFIESKSDSTNFAFVLSFLFYP